MEQRKSKKPLGDPKAMDFNTKLLREIDICAL